MLTSGFLGKLSDKYGRKPVIAISTFGQTLVAILYTLYGLPLFRLLSLPFSFILPIRLHIELILVYCLRFLEFSLQRYRFPRFIRFQNSHPRIRTRWSCRWWIKSDGSIECIPRRLRRRGFENSSTVNSRWNVHGRISSWTRSW